MLLCAGLQELSREEYLLSASTGGAAIFEKGWLARTLKTRSRTGRKGQRSQG